MHYFSSSSSIFPSPLKTPDSRQTREIQPPIPEKGWDTENQHAKQKKDVFGVLKPKKKEAKRESELQVRRQ